jgi:fructose-bisphosphate aldolase, class I
MVDVNKVLKNGKALILAYDHGFEYGPTDFGEESVNPKSVLEIADSGFFTAFVCHKGIAAKYYDPKVNLVPLILKLNAKTSYHKKEDPLALQNCSVDEAIRLGAVAVGYTIYVGSEHEQEMIQEFSQIEDEAHRKGLIVVAWMYPMGSHIKNETEKNTLAYAARIGMELNADIINLKYTGDKESFEWVIKNAGKTKVCIIGGPRMDTPYQLQETSKDALASGAAGLTIGRNIWQAKHPLEVASQLQNAIFD